MGQGAGGGKLLWRSNPARRMIFVERLGALEALGA